jgi:hypothetical protein
MTTGQRECCPNCFGDRLLAEVFQSISPRHGACSYCHAASAPLLPPHALRDFIELVLGAYVEEKGAAGRPIVSWLRDDWRLFPNLDDAHAKDLLADVINDGEYVRGLYIPVESDQADALSEWNGFRDELMFRNRYFPQNRIDSERITSLFSHLVRPLEAGARWYRARMESDGATFDAAHMLAPPKGKAGHGRANPAGIPYLYLASSPDTAVAELRPHTGETASVAEVKFDADKLNIIDLATPRETVSPFILADVAAIAALRTDVRFLERLGEELTRPIKPTAATLEYVPTQYLCELIKHQGYHGVMYKSSVGPGRNLALFEPEIAAVVAVRQVQVTKVSVEIDTPPVA